MDTGEGGEGLVGRPVGNGGHRRGRVGRRGRQMAQGGSAERACVATIFQPFTEGLLTI